MKIENKRQSADFWCENRKIRKNKFQLLNGSTDWHQQKTFVHQFNIIITDKQITFVY